MKQVVLFNFIVIFKPCQLINIVGSRFDNDRDKKTRHYATKKFKNTLEEKANLLRIILEI